MLPTIITSSVIRSTKKGDSHGGIYRINLETNESHQLLDWNNPDIDWGGRGGDRGVRGLAFWGDTLYAVAGNELFAFERVYDKLRVIASYTNQYLKLTHEMWRHQDKLYICSGGTDTILVFDLVKKDWTTSYFHHATSNGNQEFDPVTGKGYSNLEGGGFMHLDSVYANDDNMWYCGAYSDGLWRYNFLTKETTKEAFAIADTHNARPYKDGMLYNISRMSRTIFEKRGLIIEDWDTPKLHEGSLINNNIPQDHAVQGYTRGMVTYDDYVITGTSPAAVNVWKFGQSHPIKTFYITNDIRNSICGMTLYEW
jgi:hypothetical protein